MQPPTRLRRALLATVLAPLAWLPAGAADLADTLRLEAAWLNADPVQLDGDAVRLSAGDQSFVAIHRAHTTRSAIGAVVLLHDPATHADSLEVVRPLRLGLPDAGWDTLSLQLPPADATADTSAWLDRSDAIGARVDAALDWLAQRQQRNQVLLALGASGPLALRYAATRADAALQGLVLISAPSAFAATAERDALASLQRPLLDIFAERDRAAVRDGAAGRLRAARDAGLGAYRQRVVSGASMGFRGSEGQLLADVRAWLKAYAAGREVRQP
ncbi:MAG: DUF3530 family protein [Gammaproteobacteria bacterium]|nr:DUF3530 family protein [Gammaproteobacteria bacterium]